MSGKFSFNELVEATGAKVIVNATDHQKKYNISTDSRNIQENEIYLPLIGEKFDGHDFINDGLTKNIQGLFIDKNHSVSDYKINNKFVLEVEDTLIALLSLASYFRKHTQVKIIAVTGSSGKTTTKELIYSVLSKKYKTQKSQLNHNNEIGVSKTLLSLLPDTEVMILEMGMRALGEIDLLAKYALPDISVITNVGFSHIGRLGSKENIAIAKTEVLKYLDKNKSMAFLYGDDNLLLEFAKKVYCGSQTLFGESKNYKLLSSDEESMKFAYKNEKYTLPIPGEHNIINSSAAIEIGKYLGMVHEEIAEGLKNYKPMFGRWEEYNLFDGSKIINDAYNANPNSVKAAIQTILEVYPDKEIWLILGDMLELGEYENDMHSKIGKWLQDKPIDTLITVGNLSKLISKEVEGHNIKTYNYDKPELAVDVLLKDKPGNAIMLLKGSRGIGLEKILKELGLQNGGGHH